MTTLPGSSLSEDVPVYSTDRDLVQACLKGNETAWKILVERYGRLVYSIPRGYGFAAMDADVVFLQVFTLLLRQLSTLRDQTRLVGWLVTMTHHESQRLARRKPVSIELSESIKSNDASLVDQVELWEQQNLVHQALCQLETPCAELLSALFLEPEKPSYEEIAMRFGIPVDSIRPARALCFKKLETVLMTLDDDFHFMNKR